MRQAEASVAGPHPGKASGAFSARVVAVLVAVGVLAFAAFIVLSAFAADLRPPESPGEHALSKSAVGFGGLVELLKADGRAVHLHRGQLGELGKGGLVVLSPPLGKEIDFKLLAGLHSDALIVLPKWRYVADPSVTGWVRRAGVADAARVGDVVKDLGFGLSIARPQLGDGLSLHASPDAPAGLANLPRLPIENPQTMSGFGIEPILLGADDSVILARSYQQDQNITIYLLSDPDLLNTHGLSNRDTAETAVKIIDAITRTKSEPVVFDLTLHGVERSRNLIQLMLQPPFLPATLCLVLAGILVGLNAVMSRRIPQPPRRELGIGALTLVENSALLVTQAGKEVAMSRRYAAMIRATITARIGGQSGLGEAQQVDLLNSVARSQKLPGFSELAAAAAAARTPSQMMAAVRNLHRWTQELGRDRRRG